MSTLREAAQQALEAVEQDNPAGRSATITALRAALAQQEKKEAIPYAWMAIGGTIWRHKTREDDVPLYTTLPRRKWYGLEEWEINDGRDQLPTEDLCNWSFRQGAYFAEAKLKEKNHE